MRHIRRKLRSIAIRRRDLLGLLSASLALAPSVGEAKFGSIFRGGREAVPSGDVLITSHDVMNGSGSTQTNQVYKAGQVFRVGDVPPGSMLVARDINDNALTLQYDQEGLWYNVDSSKQHVAFTVAPPSLASGASTTIKFYRRSGTYAPTTPRSVSELTANHTLQLRYENVVDQTGAIVASGNLDFDVNAAIAAGRVETLANGPWRLAIRVWGNPRNRSTLAAYTNALCEFWIDILTDPASPANVKAIPFYARLSQPFIDATSPVALIGQARIYDASTLLVDLSGSAQTYTFPSSGVTTGGFRSAFFTIPGNDIQTGDCYKITSSGSTPAPLTNGQFIFATTYTGYNYLNQPPQTIFPCVFPREVGAGASIALTTQGSGTITLRRYQVTFPYQGFVVTSQTGGDGNTGGRIFLHPTAASLVSDPLLVPNLDGVAGGVNVTQKTYWQSTGLVPGWALPNRAIATSMDDWTTSSDYSGSRYRPGSGCMSRLGGDAGSDNVTIGAFGEIDARVWVRQGVSGRLADEYNIMRCMALTTAHLNYIFQMRQATNRIVATDNGSDNAGAVYPGLGAPQPNTFLFNWQSSSNHFGVAEPPNAGSPQGWGDGSSGLPYGGVSHWPFLPYIAYLTLADELFLDHVYQDMSRTASSCAGFTGSETARAIQYDGVGPASAVYAKDIVMPSREDRNAQGIRDFAAACVCGAESNPEKAYARALIRNNGNFYNYYINTWKHPTFANLFWNIPQPFSNAQMLNYLGVASAFAYNCTRDSNIAIWRNARAKQMAIFYDGSTGNGSWWGPCYNWYVIGVGTFPNGGGWTPAWDPIDFIPLTSPHGLVQFPTTGTQIAASLNDGINISGAGLWNWAFAASVNDYIPTNGDKVWPISNAGTLPIPPEMVDGQQYVVCNVQVAPIYTFEVANPATPTTPIPWSAPFSNAFIAVQAQYNPPTGCQRNRDSPTGYLTQELGAMSEGLRSGAVYSGLATAVAAANSRWETGFAGCNTWPNYAWKYCATTDVTVV